MTITDVQLVRCSREVLQHLKAIHRGHQQVEQDEVKGQVPIFRRAG